MDFLTVIVMMNFVRCIRFLDIFLGLNLLECFIDDGSCEMQNERWWWSH